MDSGDRSNNQLKAPDSGFHGGFRSQSVSNLFQGFFGVKHAPASMTDITSGGAEDKSSDERSLETIVSPSHDESWMLSHFLQARREEDDRHLRRNVTWSELGKSALQRLPESTSSASSTTDISQTDAVVDPRLYDSDGGSSGSKVRGKSEEPAKPKIVVAKNKEQHPHYQRNILSSFLSHDSPHYEANRNVQISELDRSQHQENTPVTQAATSVAGEATGQGDKRDGSLLSGDTTSGDKIHESKLTLRDLLWSFNHEKINVSKKEMNLIASIDQ